MANRPDPPVPVRIGPCEFELLGSMGSRRWLIERRRLNPLVRGLRRATDPLFRRVGIDLDAN